MPKLEAEPVDTLADIGSDETFRDDRLLAQMQDIVTGYTTFGIRLVDTPKGRNEASMLIHKMYAWRGLEGTHAVGAEPNRITLMGHRNNDPLGTLTVGLDAPEGLLADRLFKEEIDAYRARGARVCEIIKMAFDIHNNSKAYMGAMIHLAVMFARDIHHCDSLFIEVTPRQGAYYEHMLGFRQLGETKVNPRVNVRGMLMCVELSYATEQIQLYGGKQGAVKVRSFYPYFFSPREEAGIINRLRGMQ